MFIPGDTRLPVYEVEFEVTNPLTKQAEHKWEYVHSKSVPEARAMVAWKYGQHVNFLNVEVDVDV